jgi:hypothetical protein
MSNEALRIYVSIDDDAMLPEAERRAREETLAVLRDAGIATPDVETDAAPGGVIDQNEEVSGGVRVTVRMIPAAIRGQVEIKIMAALAATGLDPHVEPYVEPCEG